MNWIEKWAIYDMFMRTVVPIVIFSIFMIVTWVEVSREFTNKRGKKK